jgi:hypothetical protein
MTSNLNMFKQNVSVVQPPTKSNSKTDLLTPRVSELALCMLFPLRVDFRAHP